MAEEFQTGICGGGSWWNAAKGGFDLSASVAAGASAASCSASVSDAGGFGWSTMEAVEGRAAGYGEDSVAPTASGGSSSVTFQEAPSVHVSYPMPGSGFLLESTLPMVDFGLSSPTAEWNQALHRSSGKIDLGGFHAMLQYDPSSRSYFRHGTDLESHQITSENESMDLLKGMNHGFIQDQPHVNSDGDPGDFTAGSFPTLLQRLFDQEVKTQTSSSYDNRSSNFMAAAMSFDRMSSSEDTSQGAWSKFPQMLKVSPPEHPPPSPQLQFSNNTPFWNASAVAADARSGYYPLPQPPPFATHRKIEEKPVGSTLTAKCSSVEKRSGKNEPAFKKPRVETPSSLPTFKVRKEKLGDRITALQQLVSPFGKTDTASVLLEAIEYIKFLHEQVSVLSTPYLKNGQGMQQQQNPEKSKDTDGPKQDLRSRGLCLVPISSTFAVANEPISDFWTPTFGGITYK